jgi:GTP pyrophosphokinase
VLEEFSTQRRTHELPKGGIRVKGIDDVAVRFSKCCSPVPGDEIVGFITRGRGVSIHRTDCINVLCMEEADRARLIDAEWATEEGEEEKEYTTEINIYADNRQGIVFEISKIFNEGNISLTGMNVRISKQEKATITVQFGIRSKEQLNKIIAKIRNVEGIIDIERTTG